MIRCIHRDELDIIKYDYCIENSKQSLIYGYSWYLDIVSEHWSVLVLDDYKAVMPLPWKKKYSIKYIVQPFFCQQLGVFSLEEDKSITDVFIEAIPKEFRKIYLQFSALNKISKDKVTSERINYILSLQGSYKDIYKKFSKGRKHAIKQGVKNELSVSNFSIDELISIAKKHYAFKDFSLKEYNLLKRLVINLQKKNKVALLGTRNEKDILIGGAVFLMDQTRIIYLFSVMSSEGKEKQVASFLLNTVIEKYAETNYILDFEGSMIDSIASFFRSFGAIEEHYSFLEIKNLPKMLRLFTT